MNACRVLTDNLTEAVKKVRRTPNPQKFPVLDTALIEFRDGYLCVTTTDLKETTTQKVGCKLDGASFCVCVPMTKKYNPIMVGYDRDGLPNRGRLTTIYPLYDYLKTVSFPILTLEYKDEKLTITAGSSRATFLCLPSNEFPRI